MRLKINNHWISWEEIANSPSITSISEWQNLDDYAQNTLVFCREWLTGKNTFKIYTSGSTGLPKPIIITRSQMQASARMTARALSLAKRDKALVCLNTGYIAGKMMLVRGFETGMEMTVITPRANPLADFSRTELFHFTAFVPLQLKTILAETPEKLSILHRMKSILVGGAPVDSSLEKALKNIQAPIYSTYGMTETVSHIALRRLNGPATSQTYKVLEGVEISSDTRGCLKIKGSVTNNREIITNDVVTITDAKHFHWLGRIDHVINSGGIKVHPEAIEALIEKILQKIQMQCRFFVAGLPDKRLGEKVVLVVEGEKWEQATEKEIMHLLAKDIKGYALPKSIHYHPEFYLTPTGKIARKAILEKLSIQAAENQ